MEIKCILKCLLDSQTGTSQTTGNQWQSDEWLVVVPGPREKKMVFRVRGLERCQQWRNFFDGMPDKNVPVLIRFEIDAHENTQKPGQWFNTIEAWDISITSW